MRVLFDVPHLYYLPQFEPVAAEILRRGGSVGFQFRGFGGASALPDTVPQTGDWHFARDDAEASDFYRREPADWIIFGNSFSGAEQLRSIRRTALLFHSCGTSMKNANLAPGLGAFHVRFVPGEVRLPLLEERYPDTQMVLTGFAKLDPFFSGSLPKPELDWTQFGLDPGRKTLLYAPTFYPSSIENMPRDWPIRFPDCNLVIKPHDFTLSKSRYRGQREALARWAGYENVRISAPGQYNLLPFMGSADVMITDASSAIFEFAALNKGVAICDFVRLRWTYRGPFSYRLRRRMDATTGPYMAVAERVPKPHDLEATVRSLIEQPDSRQVERDRFIDGIIGPRDGAASKRIVDFLLA